MRSMSEFRAQRASCLPPKEASNSLASADSFSTQFTVYRIGFVFRRATEGSAEFFFFFWLYYSILFT